MFVWSFLKWLGRVTLWIVFLPLGLWRSVVHGRKKHERRQAKLIADAIGSARERPVRRDASDAELADEPELVLQAMVDGELGATERTRQLAADELANRRARAARSRS